MKRIQRKEYLLGKYTHSEYYGQFVNDEIKEILLSSFSIARLTEAHKKDKHFNSIPLKEWDKIVTAGVGQQMKQCGDAISLAGKNCVLKETARQIVEGC